MSWTKKYGFSYEYARRVISCTVESSTKSGAALEIVRALNVQGMMNDPVDDGLIWPSEIVKKKEKKK
ncbi:MAG: hypothetical protein JZU65_22680 [Chlorobium sp.]|nr:hypothetical protein [Chlorobium sp.]